MSTDKQPAQASAQRLAFTVPHDVLLPALTFTAKAVPSRPRVPVLSGALLASDGKTVTVEVFDYEQARRYVLDGAKCSTPGRLLVSAKKLLEMVKMLRKGERVTVTDEGTKALVTDGQTRYTLPTMPVEDYPPRPEMPATVGIIDGPVLAAVIGQVAKFSGTDETLPMMTGIRVFSEGARLSLESTDRYRLAARDFEWANEVGKFSALVRGKLLAEVVAAIAKPKGTVVTIGHAGDGAGEGSFGIEAGPARVVVRTLDGANYPPVRSLIPARPTQEVDVNAADLVATVKRVAVACEGKTTPVLLGFAPDTITVEAGGVYEATASEDVDCEYVGATPQQRAAAMQAQIRAAVKETREKFAKAEPERRDKAIADAKQQVIDAFTAADAMTVGVNPAYLVDVVATLDAKRVRLGLVDPFKPFTVVPLDADGTPVPGVTNLIMPIRVTRGEPAKPAAKTEPKPEPVAAPKAGVQIVPVDGPVNATDVTVVPGVGTTPAEPVEPETVEPVAAAAPAVVLDRNVPHDFVRATDNGKPAVWSTKCKCGGIRKAKVHDEQPVEAAAAPVEPAAPATAEPVEDGHVWMAVLGLAARIDGRMVTHASAKGAGEAVKEFGYGRTTGVRVVNGDDGKRMYVGTRSRDDANLMHQVACKHQIPVHVEHGVWPSQGATVDNQEVTQVKANDNESTPVVAAQGEQPFDHDMAAREAYTKAGAGDFAGAMALVEQGMEADRESGKPHVFSDRNKRTYGWDRIHNAVLAMQVEWEIRNDAEAAADARTDMAAEGVTVDGDADEVVEVDEPQADADEDADDEPEAEAVEADADDEDADDEDDDELAQALRAALAGQPADVIEGAIRGARARAATAAATARPQPAAPQPAAKPVVKQQPAKQAPAKKTAPVAAPVAAAAGVDWSELGMTEPTSDGAVRTYELPIGTRVRAARKALLDEIAEAHGDGALAERPKVDADKSGRLNKLVVTFTSPAALGMAAGLVDALLADALPEFMPQAANA